MTAAKPTVTTEDHLSKACAKVGRFLHEFALVEEEINKGIAQILALKGDAAEVVANGVDFIRKANLLRTVALETAPEAERAASASVSAPRGAQQRARHHGARHV